MTKLTLRIVLCSALIVPVTGAIMVADFVYEGLILHLRPGAVAIGCLATLGVDLLVLAFAGFAELWRNTDGQ